MAGYIDYGLVLNVLGVPLVHFGHFLLVVEDSVVELLFIFALFLLFDVCDQVTVHAHVLNRVFIVILLFTIEHQAFE